MIQVYVAVRSGRQVTIPLVACEELEVAEGAWLRLSVVERGRALLEHVTPQMPEPGTIRGTAAFVETADPAGS